MKQVSIAGLVLLGSVCCYADVVSDTRLALDQVMGRLDLRRNWAGVYMDYGIICSTNAEYRALAVTVSNQWQTVLGNLSRCATNQLERLLVLGVRDQFDETFFCDYVEGVFDLWQTGVVSKVELDWVRTGDRPGFGYFFERRYNVERVRRLVSRFREAEPNRSQWRRVLSGEAYTNYMENVEAGIIGPE